MPKLLSKAPFNGVVTLLLANPDRKSGLEKHAVKEIRLLLSGIEGDCHGGLTRKSDSRMMEQFKRGTEVRNARQISMLAVEELADIAKIINIPEVKPQWVGANMVTAGIPDLSFRAHQPLSHRCYGQQKGACNLLRFQTAQRSQG